MQEFLITLSRTLQYEWVYLVATLIAYVATPALITLTLSEILTLRNERKNNKPVQKPRILWGFVLGTVVAALLCNFLYLGMLRNRAYFEFDPIFSPFSAFHVEGLFGDDPTDSVSKYLNGYTKYHLYMIWVIGSLFTVGSGVAAAHLSKGFKEQPDLHRKIIYRAGAYLLFLIFFPRLYTLLVLIPLRMFVSQEVSVFFSIPLMIYGYLQLLYGMLMLFLTMSVFLIGSAVFTFFQF